MIHVTCRLTAKNRDQLRNPTLSNRVWATFTFLHWRQLANTGRSFCSASNTNMGGANVRSRSATWLLSGVRSVSVGGKRPQGSGAQRCRCHSQLITFSPRWHFVTVVPDLLLGLEKGVTACSGDTATLHHGARHRRQEMCYKVIVPWCC